MTNPLIILSFLLISLAGYSQDTLRTIVKSDLDFSYRNNWVYIELKDTMVVEIIDHVPAPAPCGIFATASVTIVRTEGGDTIRIISLCNTSDKYKKGQTFKVAPAVKPPFGVLTPFTLSENPKTKEFEPSVFDLTILRTAWGELLDS